jgi:hypothetical protein
MRSRFVTGLLSGAEPSGRATDVTRSKTCSAVTFGLSANWRSCASPATSASACSSSASAARSAMPSALNSASA